jgi:hypothetical protein
MHISSPSPDVLEISFVDDDYRKKPLSRFQTLIIDELSKYMDDLDLLQEGSEDNSDADI